jgi:protein-disulfide isomerase
MMRCISRSLVFLFALSLSVAAQTTNSVQQQIDELKRGQAQILKELEELRGLLKEQRKAGEPKQAPSYLSVNVHGERFRGNPQARVAILEYSDFDCAFCAQYATQVFPQIDANYVQTGKIKYFFRDMPSPEHPNAMFKAKVARCAGEQGKFWEMHDFLFANQKPLSQLPAGKLAQAVGMNVEKLGACLASDKYSAVIDKSLNSAERMQINGTPAFLIGTLSDDGSFLKSAQVVVGAQTYGYFQKEIDELLTADAPPATRQP